MARVLAYTTPGGGHRLPRPVVFGTLDGSAITEAAVLTGPGHTAAL
jgi:hypothetical protein